MYFYNPTSYYNHNRVVPSQKQNWVNSKYHQRNGLNLTWEDVCVDYKTILMRKPKKRILKNQYGKLNEGALVGLLGSR